MPVDQLSEQRLTAAPSDPYLGVHVVSEYLYCQRAGTIAMEANEPDPGQELRSVRLGHLPKYEAVRLEQMIGRLTARLVLIALGTMLLLGVYAAAAWSGVGWAMAACWVLFLALGAAALHTLGALFVLTWRLAEASGAKPQEPDFTGTESVSLPWWSLVAAGYELHQWPDPITVDRWRLSGRPWRVLARGNTVIPVLLSTRRENKLGKNHYARIAAYCALLSESAGVESPFGVVLISGTTQCIAIRNSKISQEALSDGVVGMRDLKQFLEIDRTFATAPPPSRCWKCPLGELKPYPSTPVIPGETLPLPVLRGNQKLQSVCGMRFNFHPPHQSAVSLSMPH